MPPTLTYPGVYIQEIPSGSRTITGVATAVAAFVGRAPRGPVDEPVEVGSFQQFERIFGGLWRSSGLGYAVFDYYANGGSQAVIVRLGGGAVATTIDLDGDATLVATGPGTWGNEIEVEVTHADDPEATIVATQQGVPATDLFHLTVREGTRDNPRLVETYPNVTTSEGPRRIDNVLAASQLVRVQTPFTAVSGRPAERDQSTATSSTPPPATGRTARRSSPPTTAAARSPRPRAASTRCSTPISSRSSACRRRTPRAICPTASGPTRSRSAATSARC